MRAVQAGGAHRRLVWPRACGRVGQGGWLAGWLVINVNERTCCWPAGRARKTGQLERDRSGLMIGLRRPSDTAAAAGRPQGSSGAIGANTNTRAAPPGSGRAPVCLGHRASGAQLSHARILSESAKCGRPAGWRQWPRSGALNSTAALIAHRRRRRRANNEPPERAVLHNARARVNRSPRAPAGNSPAFPPARRHDFRRPSSGGRGRLLLGLVFGLQVCRSSCCSTRVEWPRWNGNGRGLYGVVAPA